MKTIIGFKFLGGSRGEWRLLFDDFSLRRLLLAGEGAGEAEEGGEEAAGVDAELREDEFLADEVGDGFVAAAQGYVLGCVAEEPTAVVVMDGVVVAAVGAADGAGAVGARAEVLVWVDGGYALDVLCGVGDGEPFRLHIFCDAGYVGGGVHAAVGA